MAAGKSHPTVKKPVRNVRVPGIEHEDKNDVRSHQNRREALPRRRRGRLKFEKVAGEPGEIVEFGEVLVVGGDNVKLGAPTVAGAMVAAEVVEQGRGPKVIAFKKRRRKNSRSKRGHRQEFTLIRITEILTDGKKADKNARRRETAPPRQDTGKPSAPRGRAKPSSQSDPAEK